MSPANFFGRKNGISAPRDFDNNAIFGSSVFTTSLEILESSEESISSTPENYDELISIGWKKFNVDADQIIARSKSEKLSLGQAWVIEKLMKMSNDENYIDKSRMIEKLREAFSISIPKSRLKKELEKMRKGEMENSELLKALSELYLQNELKNKTRQDNEENETRRILYSEYLSD